MRLNSFPLSLLIEGSGLFPEFFLPEFFTAWHLKEIKVNSIIKCNPCPAKEIFYENL